MSTPSASDKEALKDLLVQKNIWKHMTGLGISNEGFALRLKNDAPDGLPIPPSFNGYAVNTVRLSGSSYQPRQTHSEKEKPTRPSRELAQQLKRYLENDPAVGPHVCGVHPSSGRSLPKGSRGPNLTVILRKGAPAKLPLPAYFRGIRVRTVTEVKFKPQ